MEDPRTAQLPQDKLRYIEAGQHLILEQIQAFGLAEDLQEPTVSGQTVDDSQEVSWGVGMPER